MLQGKLDIDNLGVKGVYEVINKMMLHLLTLRLSLDSVVGRNLLLLLHFAISSRNSKRLGVLS